jgi:hypothetical protein
MQQVGEHQSGWPGADDSDLRAHAGCIVAFELSAMNDGIEIRLFDPRRKPTDWTDVIGPTQCAVLLQDRKSSVPLSPAGRPFARVEDATCLLFDHLEAAQKFCEAKVLELPNICCEIMDAQGRAHPPLMVITHPDYHREDDTGPTWSRRRRLISVGLVLISGPLLWLDWRHHGMLVVPTLLAFNCILLAMRFLYWDFGVRHRENERRKRLAAHRGLESGDA